MIARVWHGWTRPEKADSYETLLKTEIIPGILARNIDGLLRFELLRRPVGDEVEFATVMWFASLDAIKAFAGEDWERGVVPPAARAVLAHFDATSQHYEVREQHQAT